jgi:hypothetical protein
MGGGMFHSDSRVIAIDPDWPFTGDGLLLTMEHEYGHALGLPHRWGNSIMKPGWDPPFASGPTEEDFQDLRNLRGAGALLYQRGPWKPTSFEDAGVTGFPEGKPAINLILGPPFLTLQDMALEAGMLQTVEGPARKPESPAALTTCFAIASSHLGRIRLRDPKPGRAGLL